MIWIVTERLPHENVEVSSRTEKSNRLRPRYELMSHQLLNDER